MPPDSGNHMSAEVKSTKWIFPDRKCRLKNAMAGSVTTTTSVGVPVTGEEEEAAMAAVRDMLGPNQKVLSVEKTVVVREEEV